VSRTYIGAELRRLVIFRADRLCEYCLIHEEDTFLGCEVDHVISEKHGGRTDDGNLALACLFCNRNKGSDIATLVPGTDRIVRFYNPRADVWQQHFRLGRDGVTVIPLTECGEATVRILGINDGERLHERDTLREAGRYPSPEARRRMTGTL
jgi:hypothetical protein